MATWTTLRDAIAAWVVGRTGLAAVWADQNYPQPARPFLRLGIIAGPLSVGGVFDELRTSSDASAYDVTVTPVVQNSATYTVTIDGTPHTIMSDGSATAAEIVAALVASINASLVPVTATNNGNGTMRLLHDQSTGLFLLGLTGNLSYYNNDAGHEIVHTICGMRSITVSVQAIAADSVPPNDAVSIAEKAYNGLRLPSVLSALDVAGLAVNERLPIRRMPETEGSQRVDRAGFDVRMSYAENLSERTGYIEKAKVTSNLGALDPDVQINNETFGVA